MPNTLFIVTLVDSTRFPHYEVKNISDTWTNHVFTLVPDITNLLSCQIACMLSPDGCGLIYFDSDNEDCIMGSASYNSQSHGITIPAGNPGWTIYANTGGSC